MIKKYFFTLLLSIPFIATQAIQLSDLTEGEKAYLYHKTQSGNGVYIDQCCEHYSVLAECQAKSMISWFYEQQLIVTTESKEEEKQHKQELLDHVMNNDDFKNSIIKMHGLEARYLKHGGCGACVWHLRGKLRIEIFIATYNAIALFAKENNIFDSNKENEFLSSVLHKMKTEKQEDNCNE